jgi:ribosomal protein S26
MGYRYCLNVVIHTRKVHNGIQVLPECCYTYTESTQWDTGTAWMLLYIHGKYTMGCRYCLNVVIHTRKVHNGMQVLPSTCISLCTFRVCITTFRQYLYLTVNFPCMYNNIQAVPVSHCELSVYCSQWDTGTAWMLLYIHGKFTMGYRYCLNVAIHTRKVHSEIQVLPECCYTYTESSQWDTGTAWMLLYIHGKFTVRYRYCLNVAIHTRKVHSEIQVLPECCYTYTESTQWDTGTAWMLLYIHGKFTMGYRYCLNVV